MQIAADAMVAASAKHAFMGMTKMGMAAIFETRGNQDTHVILRGGKQGPNYDAASVDACCAVLRKAGQREQVMIDFSHANSNKSHLRQVEVAQDVAAQLAGGDARITGVMIESHLEEGRQDLTPASRCAPACRSPTPAWAGRRPRRCWTRWPRRCASAAKRAPARPDAPHPAPRLNGAARGRRIHVRRLARDQAGQQPAGHGAQRETMMRVAERQP